MNKKEKFIEEITNLIESALKCQEMNFEGLSADAADYFNSLALIKEKDKSKFTENGKNILKYMQENKDFYNNLFKAKDIGEGLSVSSRTVSGSIRKLVSDGYVEKMGDKPIVYSLSELGTNVNVENE